MSEEPDDYEGPWPEGDAMTKPTIDDVMEAIFNYAQVGVALNLTKSANNYKLLSEQRESMWYEIRAALESLAAPVAQEQSQGDPVSAFQRSAPERIWLMVGDVDDGQEFDDIASDGDEWAPWVLRREHDDDVPYVRADLANPPRADAELARLQSIIDDSNAENAMLRAHLERLRAALEDVRLLASRAAYRNEGWAKHMRRFCESAGVVGSPLRGDGK